MVAPDDISSVELFGINMKNYLHLLSFHGTGLANVVGLLPGNML